MQSQCWKGFLNLLPPPISQTYSWSSALLNICCIINYSCCYMSQKWPVHMACVPDTGPTSSHLILMTPLSPHWSAVDTEAPPNPAHERPLQEKPTQDRAVLAKSHSPHFPPEDSTASSNCTQLPQIQDNEEKQPMVPRQSLPDISTFLPPCPSPTPRVYSNSCPLSRGCHPTISSCVIPFSSSLSILLSMNA